MVSQSAGCYRKQPEKIAKEAESAEGGGDYGMSSQNTILIGPSSLFVFDLIW